MVYMKDYVPTPYTITNTDLLFDLNDDHTRVESVLEIVPNPNFTTGDKRPSIITLVGASSLELPLVSVAVNGIHYNPLNGNSF